MEQSALKKFLQFKQHPPKHFCATCHTIIYEDELICSECDSLRPTEGWLPCALIPNMLLGRILDNRYLVTKHIGRGASADVYRVLSLTILRQFAVKVIDISSLSPDSQERTQHRLLREVDILGRLHNPHIVSATDIFHLNQSGTQTAIVMNLVSGKTLGQLIQEQGPLHLSRAYPIIDQIILALSAAHQAQVIHRDLKPDNVMVEALDFGADFVHLLDFGMAIAQDFKRSSANFAGTPMFASPEQIHSRRLDFRSDIYSLGALFCYIFTGSPPFYGSTIAELIAKHLHMTPPRLSELAPLSQIPLALEDLVASMLAKDPEDRPQSLDEIRQVILSLAPELATLSSPPKIAAPSPHRNLQILVVGGDAQLHLQLHNLDMLATSTFHFVADLEPALDAFFDLQPDLIIVAQHLPSGFGLSLCAQLRRFSQIPILLCADSYDEQQMINALEMGVDEYVLTPLNIPLFEARLNVLLRFIG